jgi:hypothetical protein
MQENKASGVGVGLVIGVIGDYWLVFGAFNVRNGVKVWQLFPRRRVVFMILIHPVIKMAHQWMERMPLY